MSSRIGLSRPGDKVKIKVWRDQAERELEATLGSARGADERATETAAAGDQGRLGLSLRPLTRQERQRAEIENGLVVQGVQGAAARAGLEPGDVVLAINGRPVDALDDVRRILDAKPRSVALLVWREGNRLFIPVQLG